jgi:predicted Rossmann-fold nucleotide-binding protein
MWLRWFCTALLPNLHLGAVVLTEGAAGAQTGAGAVLLLCWSGAGPSEVAAAGALHTVLDCALRMPAVLVAGSTAGVMGSAQIA